MICITVCVMFFAKNWSPENVLVRPIREISQEEVEIFRVF